MCRRQEHRWSSPDAHIRFVLAWNARRLAVLDRDVEAIVRTHARDQQVAAWLHETAKALAEIDRYDLAIEWAKKAADFDRGHQSLEAAGYWCDLLAEHQPAQLVPARLEVFRRWPSTTTAHRLHEVAGSTWAHYGDEVLNTLAPSPRDAVLFVLLTLGDPRRAWNLAQSLPLHDDDTWAHLARAYESIEPLAVLPILARLVEHDLEHSDARHYRNAAHRLADMRRLAAGTAKATEIDNLITGLRRTHHRRPRLQREFDAAGLP